MADHQNKTSDEILADLFKNMKETKKVKGKERDRTKDVKKANDRKPDSSSKSRRSKTGVHEETRKPQKEVCHKISSKKDLRKTVEYRRTSKESSTRSKGNEHYKRTSREFRRESTGTRKRSHEQSHFVSSSRRVHKSYGREPDRSSQEYRSKSRRGSEKSTRRSRDKYRESSSRSRRARSSSPTNSKNSLTTTAFFKTPDCPLNERSQISKTIAEYTEFCKRLSNDANVNLESENDEATKPFINHPFTVKEAINVVINVKNAIQLPVKSPAERVVDAAKVRIQFPVSSGQQHRTGEMEWVPVSPKNKKSNSDNQEVPNDSKEIYSKIEDLVSLNLGAIRRLSAKPRDTNAINDLYQAQNKIETVSQAMHQFGVFTGNTGVKVLSPDELHKGYQAWVHKGQFKEATPIKSGVGMTLLKKMGWNPGEGLGKNKEGSTEPLLLDIKTDKKGLVSSGEVPKQITSHSGKHPVSFLMELCAKKKWKLPLFEVVLEGGPPHDKSFMMRVLVNQSYYQPNTLSSTKKEAKCNAAIVALQGLGVSVDVLS